MQDISSGRLFVRVEVEPAALLHIPGDGEGLQPPARQLDQVLLEGFDSEGVLGLEIGGLSVGPLGVDHEAVALREETRGDAQVREGGVLEITADGGLGGSGPWLSRDASPATAAPVPGGSRGTDRCPRTRQVQVAGGWPPPAMVPAAADGPLAALRTTTTCRRGPRRAEAKRATPDGAPRVGLRVWVVQVAAKAGNVCGRSRKGGVRRFMSSRIARAYPGIRHAGVAAPWLLRSDAPVAHKRVAAR